MNLRPYCIASALFLISPQGFAGTALSGLHPEEAYPDNVPPVTAGGPYAPLITQVQQKLHERGFDAGPINGAFNSKTQAALTQFQLAQTIDASGSLNDATLHALGIERSSPESASADDGSAASGASAQRSD